MRIPRALGVASSVFLLALPFGVGCGRNDVCNEPLFTTPTIPGGVRTSAQGNSASVTWPRDPEDVLPDAYYAGMTVLDSDSGIDDVKVVAARELDVSLASDLATIIASKKAQAISLELPDNYGYAECHHPGMADRYFVDLTLTFASATQISSASFSKVTASRGGCAMGVGTARGAAWVFMASALVAAALRRATGPRARRSGVAGLPPRTDEPA